MTKRLHFQFSSKAAIKCDTYKENQGPEIKNYKRAKASQSDRYIVICNILS